MPVDGLSGPSGKEFARFLDAKTAALARELPRLTDQCPNWGAARKVLSIFLRNCAMNRDLHRSYRLARVEPFLEVPLDRQVVAAMDRVGGHSYAARFSISGLDRRTCLEIQEAAVRIAARRALFRYQLDVLFWNAGDET